MTFLNFKCLISHKHQLQTVLRPISLISVRYVTFYPKVQLMTLQIAQKNEPSCIRPDKEILFA